MDPEQAYHRAIAEGPNDETRDVVLGSLRHSYYYACYVERVIFEDGPSIYIKNFYNIGMPYIMERRLHVGFLPLNVILLDVL